MIAIKDMKKLPKNCFDCHFQFGSMGDEYCGLTLSPNWRYAEKRHPECPLVEVKYDKCRKNK